MLYLKPAYIRPPFYAQGGSPHKKSIHVDETFERRETFGSDTEKLKGADTGESQNGHQGHVPVPSNDIGLATTKPDQCSVEWPELGVVPPRRVPETLSPDGSHPRISQATQTPEKPPRVQTPNPRESTFGDDKLKAESTPTQIAPTDMAEVVEKAVDSSTSKTPSPKKKKEKSRRQNRNEATAETSAQGKQRKEMLSNLRTEKLNAAVSIPVTQTSGLGNQEQTEAAGVASLSGAEESLGHQETERDAVDRSPIRPEEHVKADAVEQGDQSTGVTSPAQSASTHDRKRSSASIVMPTDPTSYAQSEYRDNTPTETQTDAPRAKNGLTVSAPQSAQEIPGGPVDVTTLDKMLAAAADLRLSADEDTLADPGQVAAQSSIDGRPPDFSSFQLGPEATKVPQKGSDSAIQDDKGHVSSVQAVKSESSSKPEAIADIVPGSTGEVRPQIAKFEHVDGAKQTTKPAGNAQPEQGKTISPLHVKPSSETPLGATTQSNTDNLPGAQPPRAPPPMSMRGPIKDPKVLVAVPKLLPPIRKKPHTRGKDTKGMETLSEPTVSSNLRNTVKGTNEPAILAVDAPKDCASDPSASLSTVNDDKTLVVPAIEDDKGSTVASTNEDGIADKSNNMQAEVEDTTEACEAMSATESVSTVEDNAFDPDTSTPQRYAAAMDNIEKDEPAPPTPEQQPAISQKKTKKRKGKKKSKKSKISNDDPMESDNKTSAQSTVVGDEEKAVTAPIVETPFLSDKGETLPQPRFTLLNHSSRRLRKGEPV